MLTSNKRHIGYLAEYLAKSGIEDVIISPGSRNAPLILAFKAHPKINCLLIHDERVAAFVALGMAEAKKKPVAITCTSGTALLNYSPAIAEAYYRQIPLIVLSADRPLSLIDQGDGQTIRQQGVYSNFIKASYQMPDEMSDNCFEKSTKLIAEATQNLISLPSGPIHLNIPFDEPLYNTAELESFEIELPQTAIDDLLDSNEIEFIQKAWSLAAQKLILIGQHDADPRLLQFINQLADDPSVAILVENTSNISNFARIVHNIDRTLAAISDKEIEKFQPDLLLTIGGAVVSKRIKAFLRNAKPKHNWRVGVFTIQEDTYQHLTKAFKLKPTDFLCHLLGIQSESSSNFGGIWKQKDLLAKDQHDNFIPNAPYADLTVFDFLLDSIPDTINLHMANSSVVRYCQLFNPIKGHVYFSNRGVSGIDGSSSTAAGFSMVEKDKLNLLITGDISFFYDSNAFWNEYLGSNFKVVLINNGGGGIFQIIEGPQNSPQPETFFAPFNASAKGICDAYTISYSSADSFETLSIAFEQFILQDKNDRPSVLEIFTNKQDNAGVLKDYFKAIAAIVNA